MEPRFIKTRRQYLKSAGLAGTFGLTSLAGCTGSVDGELAVRYANLMPLSGLLAPVGPAILDGAMLPANQLRASDVDVDIDVEFSDTQTGPDRGVSEASQLVEDGYPVIIGPVGSAVTLRVVPEVLVPNQVVGISPASTRPELSDIEDDGFFFRTAPDDTLQGYAIAEVAIDRLDAETTGTLISDDEFANALETSYVNGFEEGGGTVLNRVAFETGLASYTADLDAALDGNPDVLFVMGPSGSGVRIFEEYYADFAPGLDGVVVVPEALQNPAIPEAVGNPMNDVFGTARIPFGPGSDPFYELFIDEYDEEPGLFTSHAYDAAAVAILASIAADDLSGAAIRDQIRTVANPPGTTVGPETLPEAVTMVADGESVNYSGASSNVNFDEDGDMSEVAYDVFKYTEGEIDIIDRLQLDI